MHPTIKTLCEALNITEEQFYSRSQRHTIVTARYLYFKWMKTNTLQSLCSIGATLNRDHTTVLHGIKAAQNWIDTDHRVRELWESLAPIPDAPFTSMAYRPQIRH